MPLTAVKPSQIRKIAANSLVGNNTGAEARGTSLSVSQVRTLLGLGTADSPSFSGMTLSGNLLFNATNTYDIGNGTYDPRTVRAATSVLTPLLNNTNAVGLIIGNSTHGVIVPGEIQGQKGLAVYGGGSSGNAGIRLGSMFSGYGGIWDYAVTPSTTNYAIATDATSTYINCTTGIYFRAANVDKASLTSAGVFTASTSVITPLLNNTNAAALTLGNPTYGVTVPGAAVVSGDISMSKTSAQGYIRAYYTDGVKNVAVYHNNGNGNIVSSAGGMVVQATAGNALIAGTGGAVLTSGGGIFVNTDSSVSTWGLVYAATMRSYDATGGVKYSQLTHDGTNGILSTSSGNLNLVPTGGTVAVTGGITASGNVSYAQGLSTGTVTKSANYTTTADDYCVNVTANSIDITFETAVGCANREHEVINSGSGTVTLKTTSAQTISGSASGALTLAQWKSIRVKSDGANWLIMSQIT